MEEYYWLLGLVMGLGTIVLILGAIFRIHFLRPNDIMIVMGRGGIEAVKHAGIRVINKLLLQSLERFSDDKPYFTRETQSRDYSSLEARAKVNDESDKQVGWMDVLAEIISVNWRLDPQKWATKHGLSEIECVKLFLSVHGRLEDELIKDEVQGEFRRQAAATSYDKMIGAGKELAKAILDELKTKESEWGVLFEGVTVNVIRAADETIRQALDEVPRIQLQQKAELEKAALGVKIAEKERERAIIDAEAAKQVAIKVAEGKAVAMMTEAEALEALGLLESGGQKAEYMKAMAAIEAAKAIGSSGSSKLVLSLDIAGILQNALKGLGGKS
ncbi:MAG TPA: SPFH domain-containing protein [Candidatus Bipolaricaulota bacterium]|nr:SPFH domain-containing protein [Candidatus Bipolaricaulota bacterium]